MRKINETDLKNLRDLDPKLQHEILDKLADLFQFDFISEDEAREIDTYPKETRKRIARLLNKKLNF